VIRTRSPDTNGEPPAKQARLSLNNDADEVSEIARRRALRAEILSKHRSATLSVPQSPQAAAELPTHPATPEVITLEKHDVQPVTNQVDVVSAADYDPDADKIAETIAHQDASKSDQPAEDEEDDMFASPVPIQSASKLIASEPSNESRAQKTDTAIQDVWADEEGYYRIMMGELLADRYTVTSILGRGVFSAVVGATDKQTNNALVAIKVIRNNSVMRTAGAQEIKILQLLNAADPQDRKHIVRLRNTFEHRDHLCLVFEHLALNLREVLRKFGRDVGIQVRAVRAYAGQLFTALAHLERHKVIHGDLKPDNILVSEARKTLKLCDLGSAMFYQPDQKRQYETAKEYLVSRFYRAPEIILGSGIGYRIDVWAAGCTLFEMYTGQILFPGRTNNDMLKLMMRLKGQMPARLIKGGKFAHDHFDSHCSFLSRDVDAVTGRETVKQISIAAKPIWDLKRRCLLPGHTPGNGDDSGVQQALVAAQQALLPEERALVLHLINLLEGCLALDPSRRMSALEALQHPFLTTPGQSRTK
jgi:serine/threonine-protein kinase PRP4